MLKTKRAAHHKLKKLCTEGMMLLMKMFKEYIYLPEYKSVISLTFCNMFVLHVDKVYSLQLLLQGKNSTLKCNTLCIAQQLFIGECQNIFSKIYTHLLTERDTHSPNLTLSSDMGICTAPHSYQLIN